MGFGINRILKSFSLKMLYYEIRRLKLLKKFKGKELQLGLGSKIENVELGYKNYIAHNTQLLNSTIGDYSYINFDAYVQYTIIGKFCSIGPGVKIVLGSHPMNMVSTHPAFYSNDKIIKSFAETMLFNDEYKSVIIGNDVWIGEDALIPGGINIGDGAIVAARAVVTKDVKPYSFVAGVPARHIKYRFDEETIKHLLQIKWWDRDEKWLKENHLAFQDSKKFVDFFK